MAFAGDLEFDTVAYVAGLISVFAQAGYLTLVQKASAIEAALKNAEAQVMLIKFSSHTTIYFVSKIIAILFYCI